MKNCIKCISKFKIIQYYNIWKERVLSLYSMKNTRNNNPANFAT